MNLDKLLTSNLEGNLLIAVEILGAMKKKELLQVLSDEEVFTKISFTNEDMGYAGPNINIENFSDELEHGYYLKFRGPRYIFVCRFGVDVILPTRTYDTHPWKLINRVKK